MITDLNWNLLNHGQLIWCLLSWQNQKWSSHCPRTWEQSKYLCIQYTVTQHYAHSNHDILHLSCVAHLFRGEDWDEVLVYLTDFLLHHSLVGLLLEFLTGEPEHHVFLAELRPQELPEAAATCCTFHHLLKRHGPGASVLQTGLRASKQRFLVI